MLDWLNQEIFAVTLRGVLWRSLLGLVIFVGLLRTWKRWRKQNARVKAQLQREQAFSNLGRRLNAATSPPAAAQIIAETAQELLGWDAFSLRLFELNQQITQSILDMDTIDGKRTEVATPPQPMSPLAKKIAQEGPQIILRHTTADEAPLATPFGDKSQRSASLLYVPLRDGTKTTGMLTIQSYLPDFYDAGDLEVLQKLADHGGGTLERIRAQELLRLACDEMEERVKARTRELLQANTVLHEEIEERKRTEAALAHEQHVLSALLGSSPDYIYFKDVEGRFIRVNQAFAHGFGRCEPAEMMGKTDFHFLAEKAAQESADDEQKIIQTGQPMLDKEEHEYWLDGREWWCLTSKMPYRDPAGKIIGIFGITRDMTQRKKAEQETARSEKMLRTLFEHSSDAIFVEDLQGQVLDVNPAGCRLHKMTREEIVGKNVAELVPAEKQVELKQDFPRLARGEAGEVEGFSRTRDGQSIPVSIRAACIDYLERPALLLHVRDITRSKQTEEELRKAREILEQRVAVRTQELSLSNAQLRAEVTERKVAEERFRSAVNYFPYTFVIYDAERRIQFINARGVARSGRSEAEILGRLDEEVFPAEMTAAYLPALRKTMASLAPESIEYTAVLPDGPYTAVVNFIPLLDEHKKIRQILGITYDLTERKLAEEALRQSEERFEKAFRSSPVAMTLSTVADGRYLDVNDSMVQLLGYAREEMIGHTFRELGLWSEPGLRQELVTEIRLNQSVRDRECTLLTKDGKTRETLISMERIGAKDDFIILASVYDITDRLSLEEQLRQSQKMEAVGQLAAGVAHDFNNMLTIIQGHISLLQSIPEVEAAAGDSLPQMEMAADRSANLTRQLLTFSRKQIMQPRDWDLNEVVSTTSKMLQRLLGENIVLQLNYSPHLPLVHADSGMLEQVLLNLAVNSRDAMPHGGQITITTETVRVTKEQAQSRPEARPGLFVCLTVNDTGCGMDDVTLSKVFEPFFTTKEVGKGTGLGLATVYGIVQQHGGWIQVDSAVNCGATFQIFLPTVARTAKTGDTNVVAAKISGGTETILVVEDEPALRDLVRGILEVYGYRVLEAGHGKEALQVWAEQRTKIDLLLTDLVMPEGISGVDLAEKLRQDEPNLKVIFTSGYSLDLFGDRQKMTAGVNFLPKPYPPKVLAKMLRDMLDTK